MTIELRSEWQDFLKIKRPTEKNIINWNDYFEAGQPISNLGSGRKSLRVVLEASHSGIVNDNLKFYIPSRMEEGVARLNGRPKPAKILKHHDSHQDPVGVIRDARYISTIPEGMENIPEVRILIDNSYSLEDQVNAAKKFMASGITSSREWKGLGYAEITADILDEGTIDQILAGLYDSVSTSFRSPGQAFCNICVQNLAADGLCEHEPGQKYEDEASGKEIICVWIPGIHDYKETSLVVFDADPHTAIEIGDQNNEDSISINLPDNWMEETNHNDNRFSYEFRDFKEDNNMPQPENKIENLSDGAKEVFGILKELRPDVEDDVLSKHAKDIFATRSKDSKYPDQEEAELEDKVAIEYALDTLETADQDINADEVYAEMEKELDEIDASDAKLSSEKRKRLGGSTFCGPNRSFPVPDCAHVTAARRLIGRYKGPGDKTKILACVNRKAKALDCGGSKDQNDSNEPTSEIKFEMPTKEILNSIEDNDITQLFAATESVMIERKLKVPRECTNCAESIIRAEKAEKEANEIKDELDNKDTTLRVLREELHRSYDDYAGIVDQYVELGTQLHKEKLKRIAQLSVLSGRQEDEAKAIEALEALIDADLDQEEILINDSFDLGKAAKKLNDGMSRDPEGNKVVDPTANADDGDGSSAPLIPSKAAQAAMESIKDMIDSKQTRQARELFDKMKNRKVFDSNLTFDKILAAKEKPAE